MLCSHIEFFPRSGGVGGRDGWGGARVPSVAERGLDGVGSDVGVLAIMYITSIDLLCVQAL